MDISSTDKERFKCPFCHAQSLDPVAGKNTCPDCHAEFQIDDRLECIFVDIDDPLLPIEGTVCLKCGLLQPEQSRICLLCGDRMNATEH